MPSSKPKKAGGRKIGSPSGNRDGKPPVRPFSDRAFIVRQLELIGRPASFELLCERVGAGERPHVARLEQTLRAMAKDGEILSNRRDVYGLASHMDLKAGVVQGSRSGFGFFLPDEGDQDLFLNPEEMSGLFDGDRVLAGVAGLDRRGRPQGAVFRMLERRRRTLVGRYSFDKSNGFGVLAPDNPRIQHEILIPPDKAGDACDGDYAVAAVVSWPGRNRPATGRIVEVLGDVNTPGMEIELAARGHGLPREWSDAAREAAAKLPGEVRAEDLDGRFDLRETPFVTIDGEDAKDFDDAVFARPRRRGGWTLHVAIADVSRYVEPGGALDEAAAERGTSVYFPGHVIPMLPESLSNELCSLKPKTDRLAMVCEMKIAADGGMKDFRFYEAVIRSRARLTYTETSDALEPADTERRREARERARRRLGPLVEQLDALHGAGAALLERRRRSSALDFDTVETRIVFGENRKIREIVPVPRNRAHRLIEECMLCANTAAAALLREHGLPALYRVHERPGGEKLDGLREHIRALGLHLGGGASPLPADYRRLLDAIARRPDHHVLQTMVIRSMMQAVYQPENIGHFGLDLDAYVHFTSPIRRYPDLLTHRAVRHLLRNRKGRRLRRHERAGALPKKRVYPCSADDLGRLGKACSAAERRADAANYSVVDWLKCEYMQDRVGEVFAGSVASVTKFGLFVELDGVYISGLLHVSDLKNDYYHFDPVRHSLTGEHSGRTYRLGDSLRVQVARVDIDSRQIDLRPAPARKAGRDAGGKKKKAAGRRR